MPEHQKKVTLIKRDYWNLQADHRPYRNLPHNCLDDGKLPEVTRLLLDDFSDGDVLEVTVRKVGSVSGFWQRVRAHGYEKVYALRDRSLG